MIWREGEQVGQYEVISELGHGGMATVYKAYHAQLDRHVAIKVMHQNFATDTNFAERFKREAQIVARLDHPHIVPVYDYNEYKGMPYLVMKIIQGRSLKQVLFKNPPSLEQILHIMTAIADATTYAHNKGILHRDIKPSNIVIDSDNIPYLADFGLARIAASGESTMSADVLLGTPNYMSPEQAKGAKDIDHRTDLYSLGVVLYELIVGQVPFSAPTPLAVIQDHIHTPLPRPSEINPDIPPKVEQVLRKALAKKPEQRYDSASAMVNDFKQAIQDDGLKSLTENRHDIADESLAKWRDAYIKHQAKQSNIDDSDSIAQSIRNLAKTSVVEDAKPQSPLSDSKSEPIATPQNMQSLSATAQIRHEPNARFWMMAGAGIFILCIFLTATVILNASTTIMEIADIAQQIETNETDLPNDNNPEKFIHNVPLMDIDKALDTIAEEPDNAINYLALAQAYYQADNIDDARLALDEGRAIADNSIPFLATATSIADQANDLPIAIVYGVLIWNATQEDTSPDGQLAFNNISEYLYQQSVVNQELDISRENNIQLIDMLGRTAAQQIIRSPITRIISTNNHIENGRTEFATSAIELWADVAYELPIGKLVNARYEILIEDTNKAKILLNELVETSTTPEWIVTIAQDLLSELRD